MRIRRRVDVLSDGRVVLAGGGKSHGWLSLEMVFQTTSASPTNLNETHFADDVSLYSVTEWQRPIYSVIDGICIVDGFILVRWWWRRQHTC